MVVGQGPAEVRGHGLDASIGQVDNFGDNGVFGGPFRPIASGNSVRTAWPPAPPFLGADRFTARLDAAIGGRVPLPSMNEAHEWPATQLKPELIC